MSRRYFEKKIRTILEVLRVSPEREVGVTFVTDRAIAKLNKTFRKKAKSTDVLSFPMESKECLGDVVISVDTVRRQAKELKTTANERSVFLAIHGILHLLGYDHENEKDWNIMRRKEEWVLKKLHAG